jgi:hypothetical protein
MGAPEMITWDEFRERVQRLKAERWADILASEPPGKPVRRRPRDLELEALLAEADRERRARGELPSEAKRVPPRRDE